MLHKDQYRKISIEKINIWPWVLRDLRQDELTGGKPPVFKFDFGFHLSEE
jgi:hypothetical protein